MGHKSLTDAGRLMNVPTSYYNIVNDNEFELF